MGNKQSVRILLVGLDDSGKTTAVNTFGGNPNSTTSPSPGYTFEQIKKGHYVFEIYDVAGGEKLRGLWRHYYENTKALIFMVDSTQKERFAEAKEELTKVILSHELENRPLLILANKKDKAGALAPAEIAEALELKKIAQNRKWEVIPSNALTGEGLDEGLKWFTKVFKEAKEHKNKDKEPK